MLKGKTQQQLESDKNNTFIGRSQPPSSAISLPHTRLGGLSQHNAFMQTSVRLIPRQTNPPLPSVFSHCSNLLSLLVQDIIQLHCTIVNRIPSQPLPPISPQSCSILGVILSVLTMPHLKMMVQLQISVDLCGHLNERTKVLTTANSHIPADDWVTPFSQKPALYMSRLLKSPKLLYHNKDPKPGNQSNEFHNQRLEAGNNDAEAWPVKWQRK